MSLHAAHARSRRAVHALCQAIADAVCSHPDWRNMAERALPYLTDREGEDNYQAPHPPARHRVLP